MPQTSQQIQHKAKRLFRWCLVDGRLDEHRARMAAQHILRARRRGYLLLVQRFQRLLKLENARHTAKVESAFALPFNFQARVHRSLKASYGPNVSTLFVPNRDLIGGMRVQIGSDVYDGSVCAKLDDMARVFGINAVRVNARSA
jgi:F-type H+-transporting ATPase subunit delta